MSKYIKSFFGIINKKPLVGLGVVGTNTLTISWFNLFLIIPVLSYVANPNAQIPFLGYSIKTTFFCPLSDLVNVSVI